MSRALLTCPYCNSTLSDTEVVHRAGKITCPRCQEPLPALLAASLPATSDNDPAPAPPAKRSNRRLGLLILAGMTVVALGALLFALATRPQRRARDPSDPEPIRFLPRDTNIALGIRVEDLLKDADAAPLLQEPRPPWLDWALSLIRSKTTLALADLDRIVLGTTLAESAGPLTLVIRTRETYSLQAVQKAAQPATPTAHHGRPLYRFPVAPLGEAFLWCRGNKTLIFLWHPISLTDKDLATLPAEPSSDTEAYPAPLREFMTKRLDKESLVWLVGDLKHLPRLQNNIETLEKDLPKLKEAARFLKPLATLQFIGLNLVNEAKEGDDPRLLTLRGNFRVSSKGAAAFVETLLKGVSLPGQVDPKVTGPEPDATEFWVLWQTRLGAEGIRHLLVKGF